MVPGPLPWSFPACRLKTMGFPMLSYPSAFGLEPAASGTTNDSPMPFRFLDLPKEIRLMVYERFLVTTYRDGIPLKDGQYGFTLVTTVVPGISVLATCHQIKLEASHILSPVLQKVLLAPPIVAIEASHLFTLIDLERCSCSPGITLLGKLVSCLRHPRTVGRIMRYRRGRLTAQQLWKRLHLGPLIKADDERRLRAFARFILRAAKFISSKPSTIYAYPPLIVVIEVPDTFQGMPYTVSTSYMRSVAYKVLGPRISPPPPTTTVVADLPWLLSRFAFRMSILCRFYSVVTLVVKLRLVEIGKTGRYVSKQGFQMALMRGLAGAGWMGRGVLYFGGRATKAISEEV